MTGFTRTFAKVTDDVILAEDFNDEFQALEDAFSNTTGHVHDGSVANGAYVPLISDADNTNAVQIDSTNNEIEFYTEVATVKTAQMVLQDGKLLPAVDNDIDLGSASFEFKDLYIDGTANIDSLVADTTDINGGTIDGTVIGGTTPAAGTFTTFTSTGIDDNATTETLQLGNSQADWGQSGNTFTHLRNVTDSWMAFSGSTAVNTGANVLCYGDAHASSPNVLRLRQGSTDAIRIDTNIEISKNLELDGADIFQALATDAFVVSGGTGIGAGGNVALFGESHSTKAGYVELRTGANAALTLDSSQNATFEGNVGIGGAASTSIPLKVTNNDTGSDAQIFIEQDGTGDAALQIGVPAQNWYIGVDNSASDSLLIGTGTVVGTTPALTIDSSQNATFTGALTCGTFTSTGIDDNATSTALTIDSNQKSTFSGGSTRQLALFQSTTTGAFAQFADATSATFARVGAIGDSFVVETDVTTALTIDSNQNATFANRVFIEGTVGTLTNAYGTSNPTGGTFTITEPDGSTVTSTFRVGNDQATSPSNSLAELQLFSYGGSVNSGGGSIRFFNTRYGDDAALIKGCREGTSTGKLDFYTYGSGALTKALTLDSNQNVGIGTSTPSYKLQVAGDGNGQVLYVNPSADFNGSTGGNDLHLFMSCEAAASSSSYLEFRSTNAASAWYSSGIAGVDTGDLVFMVGANNARPTLTQEVMRIDSAGRVGIGKIPEAAKLEVDQATVGTTSGWFSVNSSVAPSTGGVGILITNKDVSADSVHGISFNLYNSSASERHAAGIHCVKEQEWTTNSSTYDSALTFFTRSNGGSQLERVRISSLGHLGIGDTFTDTNLAAGAFVYDNPNSSITQHLVSIGDETFTSSGNYLSELRILSYGSNDTASGGGQIRFFNTRYANDTALIRGCRDVANTGRLEFYVENGGLQEAMRIDSSGNVGIGVTPEAWQSTRAAIQLGPTASLHCSGTTSTASTVLGNNYYRSDTGATYQVTNPSAIYYQLNGEHVWETAPSGTAGTSITFSEAMRIDSSGNVGIGTASPTARLDIQGTDDVLYGSSGLVYQPYASTSEAILKVRNNSLTDGTYAFLELRTGNTSGVSKTAWLGAISNAGSSAPDIVIGHRTGTSSYAERMRIDSSGHAIIPAGVTLGTAAGVYNAANTLDDYEEGTWTPALTSDGTAPTGITYDIQTGVYTKIGNQVTIFCMLGTDSVSSVGTGNVRVSGLPFPPSAVGSSPYSIAPTDSNNSWGTNEPQYVLASGDTSATALIVGYGLPFANVTTSDIGTGANDNRLRFTMTYLTT